MTTCESSRVESKAIISALELLGELALHTMVDRVQQGVDGSSWLLGRLGAVLINSCSDENRVPIIFGLAVEEIDTTDITLHDLAVVQCLRSRANAAREFSNEGLTW